MKAIVDGLSITTNRYASPLNTASDIYCSMYPKDMMFDANHDAYSQNWQGSSEANTSYEEKNMKKALKWAMFSIEHSYTE